MLQLRNQEKGSPAADTAPNAVNSFVSSALANAAAQGNRGAPRSCHMAKAGDDHSEAFTHDGRALQNVKGAQHLSRATVVSKAPNPETAQNASNSLLLLFSLTLFLRRKAGLGFLTT